MASKGIAGIVPEKGPFPLEVRVIRTFIPYIRGQASKHRYLVLIYQKGDAIEAKVDVNDHRCHSIIKDGACYSLTGHVCTIERKSC